MIPRDSHGRAIVPVSSIRLSNENLITRDQAGLITEMIEPVGAVVLDFADVPKIGVAFADEIFNVFAGANPGMELHLVNANPEVEKMIDLVRQSR